MQRIERRHGQQPVLRLGDTVVGVIIGVAAAWLGPRLTGQRSLSDH